MGAVEDVRLFMEPRSVAVIGASRNAGAGFFNSLECLMEYGFPGHIYPINPGAEEVLGMKAYPNVTSAPEGIDLAIITVPRTAVLPAVRECIERDIRAMIIVTQGFGDADDEGKALQEEIVHVARAGGARILGPNTMGVINAVAHFSSAFVSLTKPERKLPVGFIAQSGIAVYLGLLAHPLGLPWIGAKGIDVGDTCDVDQADALEYFGADPDTRVVAMHLEGVKDGRRLVEVATRVSLIKPIMAMKVGATEAGARAVSSHTGALVGQDQVYDAVLRQAGVIRVADLEEMEDLAKAFCVLPPIKGNRIAVLTPVGGLGVMSADACGQFGLELASYSPSTLEKLQRIFPSWMTPGNPLDVWPAAFGRPYNEVYLEVAGIVMEDPNVDAIMTVIWSSDPRYRFFEPVPEVRELVGRFDKPVSVFFYGPNCQNAACKLEEGEGVAAYPSPVRAVRALAALWKYQEYKRKLETRASVFPAG